MADMFISYSRRDTQFVLRLQRTLRKLGRDPWVDVYGVRPAEDFMQAIRAAIDSTYAFIFVLSPGSLVSAVCGRELEYALQGNKRLIPVMCQQVPGDQVPAALRDLNWISFVDLAETEASVLSGLFGRNQFEKSVHQLIEAADADLPWIQMHTRVLQRALEWTNRGRSESLLLQGEDLSSTLAIAGDKTRQPKLNDIQRQYLDASSRSAKSADPFLGDLEATKRMHEESLPSAHDVFRDEKRFSLYAKRNQARSVGGDLYDFYRLDDDRMLFLVADVSGKGLPASYLMAVMKVMFKSTALRTRSSLGDVMRQVNIEVSRDNPASLFVTVFAAILDARTGQLEYCSAGGENPFLVSEGNVQLVVELDGHSGPPLAVLDDFSYETAHVEMLHGDILCVFTDGVCDAVDQGGKFYGRDSLKALLSSLAHCKNAQEIGEAVLRDLRAFAAGTMPADDHTLLVLRWE